MTTHHRLHPHLVARTTGQSIAVATAGGVLVVLGCPVWVVLLLAAAAVLELVHDAHRRQERRWAANNQPLPDSDLSRPLAEVLPPLTRAALAASAAPEEPTMPTTLPEIFAPPMPTGYADELAATQPVRRGRWLTVGEMHPGDQFAYTSAGSEETLTVGELGVPDELVQRWARRGLAPLAVNGEPLPMPLPLAARWRMVRALRRAAVRCLVCRETEALGEYEYDLADPDTILVCAICPACEHSSTGGAS